MGALTFHEQEILSAGEKLLRQGKSLYKEDRQKVHQFSNKPMKSIIAGPLVSTEADTGWMMDEWVE